MTRTNPARLALAAALAASLALAAAPAVEAKKPAYRLFEVWDRNGVKWDRNGGLTSNPYFSRKGRSLLGVFRQIVRRLQIQAEGPQSFRLSGTYQRGQALEIDSRGNVYVLGGRDEKFTSLGIPSFKRWRPIGFGTSTLASDRLIYAFNGGEQVDRISARTGKRAGVLYRWNIEEFDFRPREIHTDASGQVWLWGGLTTYDDRGYPSEDVSLLLTISPEGEVTGFRELPEYAISFAVGPDGAIWAGLASSDTGPNIQRLSAAGAVLDEWGSFGRGPAQLLDGAADLAFDRRGRLYAVDPSGYKVVRFSRSGRHLDTLKLPRKGRASSKPFEVEVDRRGNVYVLGDYLYKFMPRKRARRMARCERLPQSGKRQRKRVARCVRKAMR